MPDQDVRGKSLLDLLWAQLDRFVDDYQELSAKATNWDTRNQSAELANARGAAHGAACQLAFVLNPYHPNVAAVKADALERWEQRQEDEHVGTHNERSTLAHKITDRAARRVARRARRDAARNG